MKSLKIIWLGSYFYNIFQLQLRILFTYAALHKQRTFNESIFNKYRSLKHDLVVHSISVIH